MQDTDPTPAVSQDHCLAAWLRLEQTPGVGCFTAKSLLARFTSPQAIFSASHAALREHVAEAPARALLTLPDAAQARTLDAILAWRSLAGNHVLTPDHPAYPSLLHEIHDPPLLLYAKGDPGLLAGPALAIVGSRNATTQGKSSATAFAEGLSKAGLTIVSGMALGIDSAAHEGALRGPGSTIAVVGTGVDRIYPRRNRELAHRIAEAGCILSEYALGTAALPANFPRRNRLISGLACGVLVVEAAAESGSLITAHIAAEQGRDVFAIPGSIHAPLAKGCHKLIRSGARLIETVPELLQATAQMPLVTAGVPPPLPAPLPALASSDAALLDTMGHGPLHGDMLAEMVDMPPGQLLAALMALELAGQVERLPGGLFQRVNR